MEIDKEEMRKSLREAKMKHVKHMQAIVKWFENGDSQFVAQVIAAIDQRNIMFFLSALNSFNVVMDLAGIGIHEVMKWHVLKCRVSFKGLWLTCEGGLFGTTEDRDAALVLEDKRQASQLILMLIKRSDNIWKNGVFKIREIIETVG